MTLTEKLQAIIDKYGYLGFVPMHEAGLVEEAIDAVLDHTLDPELEQQVQDVFRHDTWFQRRVERKLDRIITLMGGNQ